MQDVPRFCRGRFRSALTTALEQLTKAYNDPDDEAGRTRAWTLFVLMPRMLLHRPPCRGKAGKQVISQRFDLFEEGDWVRLVADARATGVGGRSRPAADSAERRAEAACASVRLGEASRGRQQLVGSAIAPGTAQTLAELRDPARRPPAPVVPIPDAVRDFSPAEPLVLDRQALFANLKSAPRGSSGGLSGMRYEDLKVLLDDEETMRLYGDVAERYARADIPQVIARSLALGAVTALTKPDGRPRGIITGDAIRRHVARTLAQTYADELMEACAPFQYALSTRAGTDCVSHALRSATDNDEGLTVVSIDGIGAFDHIRRQAMLEQLATLEHASAMLPFVRLSYGQASTYLWQDDAGVSHVIRQGEGGEQGDPLMPALYALGQHPALVHAAQHLLPGELLFAYLDDVYAVCRPERATQVFHIVTDALSAFAGVQANLGKCKMWNKGGIPPPGADTISPDVWVGGSPAGPRHQGIGHAARVCSIHPGQDRRAPPRAATSPGCAPAFA
jgi:hypothetical protein